MTASTSESKSGSITVVSTATVDSTASIDTNPCQVDATNYLIAECAPRRQGCDHRALPTWRRHEVLQAGPERQERQSRWRHCVPFLRLCGRHEHEPAHVRAEIPERRASTNVTHNAEGATSVVTTTTGGWYGDTQMHKVEPPIDGGPFKFKLCFHGDASEQVRREYVDAKLAGCVTGAGAGTRMGLTVNTNLGSSANTGSCARAWAACTGTTGTGQSRRQQFLVRCNQGYGTKVLRSTPSSRRTGRWRGRTTMTWRFEEDCAVVRSLLCDCGRGGAGDVLGFLLWLRVAEHSEIWGLRWEEPFLRVGDEVLLLRCWVAVVKCSFDCASSCAREICAILD